MKKSCAVPDMCIVDEIINEVVEEELIGSIV